MAKLTSKSKKIQEKFVIYLAVIERAKAKTALFIFFTHTMLNIMYYNNRKFVPYYDISQRRLYL